jgi:hypothetical protein
MNRDGSADSVLERRSVGVLPVGREVEVRPVVAGDRRQAGVVELAPELRGRPAVVACGLDLGVAHAAQEAQHVARLRLVLHLLAHRVELDPAPVARHRVAARGLRPAAVNRLSSQERRIPVAFA